MNLKLLLKTDIYLSARTGNEIKAETLYAHWIVLIDDTLAFLNQNDMDAIRGVDEHCLGPGDLNVFGFFYSMIYFVVRHFRRPYKKLKLSNLQSGLLDGSIGRQFRPNNVKLQESETAGKCHLVFLSDNYEAKIRLSKSLAERVSSIVMLACCGSSNIDVVPCQK